MTDLEISDLIVKELYAHVCMDFHRGNQLLGGMALGSKTIKRMGNLNLSIDFQITAWGKGFR